METTLIKSLKHGFARPQTRLEFQKSTPSRTYKTYKPTPVGRPIVLWWPNREIVIICWKLLQPIAKQPKFYLKDSTDFINSIEKNKSPGRRYSCFNGCNVPVYEHTTRGGNPNSMQGIRHILLKQTTNPKTTTGTSTKANSPRKLIPVEWKKTTSKYMGQPWVQRRQQYLLISSWVR